MFRSLTLPFRRIPVLAYIVVVLIIALLLSLSLLLSSGAIAGSGGSDPNGVTSGSLINPDGLACGAQIDPNGACQSHASGLLAAGIMIDGNG